MQSILKILELIYDFLESDNTLRSYVYIFKHVASVVAIGGEVPPVRHTWPLRRAYLPSPRWGKISVFVMKNVLHLEFSTESLIFTAIFS